MTEAKWFRAELNYLEKNSDIEINELCDFLLPKARKLLDKTYQSKKIFRFKKFSDWKNYILNLQQRCMEEEKKLIILSELSQYPRQGFNLKHLMVNKFLKQHRIDYYEFHYPGLIPSRATSKTYLKYITTYKYWRYLLLWMVSINLKVQGLN